MTRLPPSLPLLRFRVPYCQLQLAMMLMVATNAWAQSESVGRAWSVTSTASATQTVTDNASLNAEKRTDAVTLLTAGVHMQGNNDRIRLSLDYTLTGSVHAREAPANNTGNNLNAALNGVLAGRWLFLDANATVSQQAISPFGVQTNDASVDTGNRTEVRSYSLSPSVRTAIGGWVTLDGRLSHMQQSSSTAGQGGSSSDSATVSLGSLGLSQLGWNASVSRQRIGFDAGRTSSTESASFGLRYLLNSDLTLSARAGRERSDVLVAAAENTNTWGAGLDWKPSQHTQLSIQRDHRYFGEAHNVNFQQQLPLSSITFSSSRDVAQPAPTVQTATTSLYELLFATLAVEQPDPVIRRQLVLQRLAALGIDPATNVGIGFLTSSLAITSRQELGYALRGVRSTFSASIYRSESSRTDSLTTATDALSNGPVRQTGYTVTLGHRLTPSNGLSFNYSRSLNKGTGLNQRTDLRSTGLSLTGSLGTRANWSLSARHAEFDSQIQAYSENAITAMVSVTY